MRQGQIIHLNGTSSSGKSTIARALQEMLDEPYLHTGIDHFLEHYPSRMIAHSDGIDPRSADGWLAVFQDDALVEVRIGPLGYQLIGAMYRAIAALAESGINVIVDDVIYDPHVLQIAVETLQQCDVFFVGIRCALEVAERRERARGNRARGGARTFHDRVHQNALYDLEVDSGQLKPMECALQIAQGLQAKSTPHAFERLKELLVDHTTN